MNLQKSQAVVTFDNKKVKTEKLVAAFKDSGGQGHRFSAELAAAYQCETFQKTYDKPTTCCGKPVAKVKKEVTAAYKCEICGKTYAEVGECCGQPTQKAEKLP